MPSPFSLQYSTAPEDELRQLVDLLPSEEYVNRLSNIVFEYGLVSYVHLFRSGGTQLINHDRFQPIQYDEYHLRIFVPLYQLSIEFDDPLLAVRLALMYSLLAHGAQSGARVDRPAAEKFLHLSGVALAHSHLIDFPTIEGIQALFMISIYLGYSDTASRDTSTRRSALAAYVCSRAPMQSRPSHEFAAC